MQVLSNVVIVFAAVLTAFLSVMQAAQSNGDGLAFWLPSFFGWIGMTVAIFFSSWPLLASGGVSFPLVAAVSSVIAFFIVRFLVLHPELVS